MPRNEHDEDLRLLCPGCGKRFETREGVANHVRSTLHGEWITDFSMPEENGESAMEGFGGHGEAMPDYDDEISPETIAAIRQLVRSEREVDRRRTPMISELLHGVDDVSPAAAAERVRAFLDWKGEGYRSAGPSLNYGDLRILVDAVAPIAGE